MDIEKLRATGHPDVVKRVEALWAMIVSVHPHMPRPVCYVDDDERDHMIILRWFQGTQMLEFATFLPSAAPVEWFWRDRQTGLYAGGELRNEFLNVDVLRYLNTFAQAPNDA